MKTPIYILFVLLSLFWFEIREVSAQNGLRITTNANVVNRGTITIEDATLQSDGQIDNEGGNIIIKNHASTKISQPEIKGRVEFSALDPNYSQPQYIPQIIYDSVAFFGGVKRFAEDGKPLIARSLFQSDSTDIKWQRNINTEIITYGITEHNGVINFGDIHGKVKMNGINAQDIKGKGSFKILELDNNAGADVREGGGFRVSKRLELTNGIFRNDADNNFILGDPSSTFGKAEIARKNGSLAFQPISETQIDVEYLAKDDGTEHYTGPEIPITEGVLSRLDVQNPAGIVMLGDVFVNDTITANGNIRTFETNSVSLEIIAEHTLTLQGETDPVYSNDNVEVEGKFKRNTIEVGREVKFNNEYTYAQFASNEAKGNVSTLTFDIKPSTKWDDPVRDPDNKVYRTINISANDATNNALEQVGEMEMGYAWRGTSDTDNETFPAGQGREGELLMQFWEQDGGRWIDLNNEPAPAARTNSWFYNKATIRRLGDFAIGFTTLDYLKFMAKVILEGPFRNGEMTVDLWDKRLIPDAPPNLYPYNLDPNRTNPIYDFSQNGKQMPDSIVDWVVIEFRNSILDPTESYYRTCLLRKDGRLIDVDGTEELILSQELTTGLDTTGRDYYVAIRHRNHLTVITENKISVSYDFTSYVWDFSSPAIVGNTGTSSALKPIGFTDLGNVIFGVAGGNNGADQNGIDLYDYDGDFQYIWDNMFLEGWYANADTNMDGIVNTRDYNLSWNNRQRRASVK